MANQPAARYIPALTGLNNPVIEEAIRVLFDYHHDLQSKFATLAGKELITKEEVEQDFGVDAIRTALSASAVATALNVEGLSGQLAEPQPALAPSVAALPDPQFSFDGELVYLNSTGLLYRFDAMTGTPPGEWVPILGEVVKEQTITADVAIAAPTDVPTGRFVNYFITQDGTGGWVVTWNAVFKGVNQISVGRTASRMTALRFWAKSQTQFVLTNLQADIAI